MKLNCVKEFSVFSNRGMFLVLLLGREIFLALKDSQEERESNDYFFCCYGSHNRPGRLIKIIT